MRIRQQPQTEKLSISLFERAWQLFSEKSWPRTGAFDETYFDDFCGTLAHLSPDQAEMLINLTRDFLWVQDTEYIRLLYFQCGLMRILASPTVLLRYSTS